MGEDALWEGLATSSLTEIGGETEGVRYWQVSLEGKHGGTGSWFFGDDNTSSSGEGTVDTTDDRLWAGNFDQEDWFDDSWLGSELSSGEDTSGSWHDLTSTSVDGISVHYDIQNFELDASEFFIG